MLHFLRKRDIKTDVKHSTGASGLKLILHIGPHKTGTTALQDALLQRYGAKEPQRIWYPMPRANGPGHARWAAETQGKPQPDPAKKPLKHAIDQARQAKTEYLIVSSENFADAYINGVGGLTEALDGIEPHIVITLSPLRRRAVSIWQEKVKNNHKMPLSEAKDFVLAQSGMAADLVNFFAVNFSNSKISVIITRSSEPGMLFDQFARATGVPVSLPQSPADNRSLGVVEVETLRGFNIGLASGTLSGREYRRARNLLTKLFKSEEWRAEVPMIQLTLPQDWIVPLEKLCQETLAQLRALKTAGRIEVFGDLDDLDDVAKP